MINFVKVATFFLGLAALCLTSLAIRTIPSAVIHDRLDSLDSYQCPEDDYTTSTRARCDAILAEIVRPLYDKQNPAPSLYVSLDDPWFQEAWRCYAADPCFMVPPGPVRVSLDFDDGSKLPKMRVGMDLDEVTITLAQEHGAWWRQLAKSFVWHSYREWRDAMRRAVHQALRHATENGIGDVYAAVNVGSPGAGAAGDDDDQFNRTLADKHQPLMFKSELWSLIHVLPVLEHYNARGVFWLQEGSPIDLSAGATLGGESAVVIPFDASYSGVQASSTIGTTLVQTMDTPVKVYASVGMVRSKELIERRVDRVVEDTLSQAHLTSKAGSVISRSEVFVGHKVETKLFAMQFKLPDFYSMPRELSLLLQCALCCAGKDTKREPYKFFTQRQIDPSRCSNLAPTRWDPRCGDPQRGRFQPCRLFKCECPRPSRPPFKLPKLPSLPKLPKLF